MKECQSANRILVNDILEQMPDGMFTLDTNLNILYANPAFYKLLHLTSEELIGTSITQWLGDLNILTNCMADIHEKGYCNDQETIFKRKDGSSVHISKNVQALYDEKKNIHTILVSVRDLTSLHELNRELLQSKAKQERYTNDLQNIIEERTSELTYRLLHNALTGLPNRIKLLDDIEKSDSSHAMILLNIDRFNELNTFYGHRIGDELLCALAEALVELSTRWDEVIVYKLPVDEYVILIGGSFSPSQIETFVDDISHWMSGNIFTIRNQEISLSMTMGVAFSDTNEEQNLLLRADMALKRAKKMRRNYIVYDELFHIKEDYEKNLSWIKRLRSAIEEDRVVPFYQPIVNAETFKIEKYEALVRIVEEDGTVISPFHFLDIAKKVKLYHRITTIMIDKVFEALQNTPETVCSINLSIEDINDTLMHEYILNKVRQFSGSHQVIFEILESEGIENYDVVNSFIREVKKYGVQIALDDFGAGYSNFAYITKLDIDYIKIDGSIIRDININPISQLITETIVEFAAKLNIKTVAEFVCCEEVFNYLKPFRLDSMQGYFFGEPSSAMEEKDSDRKTCSTPRQACCP